MKKLRFMMPLTGIGLILCPLQQTFTIKKFKAVSESQIYIKFSFLDY